MLKHVGKSFKAASIYAANMIHSIFSRLHTLVTHSVQTCLFEDIALSVLERHNLLD